MASGTIQTTTWKHHGDFSADNRFDLPTNYDELLVVVYGGSGNVYSQIIPKDSLGNSLIGHIIGGYYYTNLNYGLVNLYLSTTEGRLMTIVDGGSNKLTTATTKVYYK